MEKIDNKKVNKKDNNKIQNEQTIIIENNTVENNNSTITILGKVGKVIAYIFLGIFALIIGMIEGIIKKK